MCQPAAVVQARAGYGKAACITSQPALCHRQACKRQVMNASFAVHTSLSTRDDSLDCQAAWTASCPLPARHSPNRAFSKLLALEPLNQALSRLVVKALTRRFKHSRQGACGRDCALHQQGAKTPPQLHGTTSTSAFLASRTVSMYVPNECTMVTQARYSAR